MTPRQGGDSFAIEMPDHNAHFRSPAGAARPRPQLIAHRGASRLRRENTLAAFAVALDQRADAIELDVHATADGVVVVHHDPVPHGFHVDGRAERQPIASLRYVDLSTLRTAGESIPTLRDALALVGDRAVVYVEIKGAGIERQVVDAVRANNARCAIHSFDHAAIGRVGALAPEIPRGLLFDRGSPAAMMEAMLLHDARDLWPESRLIDASLVDAAHRANRRVIAWTVDDAALALRLAAFGVDGVCTDDVPLIGGALGRY